MDRQELTKLIRQGPVRVTMNDGSTFDIPGSEFAIVSDISAHVLYHADDGKYRTMHLPLVTMCGVEQLSTEAP